ncbi:MAG: cobyrinate a,c-diamide synthase [Gammaproteobacteria bacterium]|nr:cobyrinate a,c-diamide synthase [Gammaproteobacteria bacterium]
MSRIFISAAHKSSGKTTVSVGLCAALKQRGLTIQSFKKGPDYIDPYWLAQATGRNCYNLDFYTMEREEILAMLQHRSQDADISLIEGNKGLYDGLDLDGSNSNAALATLTKTPIILVLNARGMTRGIAPLILGYQAFDKNVSIRGVILNRLGGSRHESKLRNVIEHYTDVNVVGAIHNDKRFDIEERHLGLIPGHEDPLCAKKIDLLAQAINEQVDINAVLTIANQAGEITSSTTKSDTSTATINLHKEPDIKLGLIRCPAFGFYYPDDLQALQSAGAEIIEIDPCKDTELPVLDAMFIGGGFPETHMQELAANKHMRTAIKDAIDKGLPCYAECGGLMYLARSIEWQHDGRLEKRDMVGCIDTDIIMEPRPQGRGYVQLKETENSLWPGKTEKIISAHEFHYSRFSRPSDAPPNKTINVINTADKNVAFAFKVKRGTGIDGKVDGYIYKNLLATYSHQRNTWNNPWAQRFINFARQHKQQTIKQKLQIKP